MIVRDQLEQSQPQLQVYMVKRPGKGDFPDLHVFPGGKLDAQDWQPDLCSDLDDGAVSKRMGVAGGALRYWVAVARECFEEVGVLLVQKQGEDPSTAMNVGAQLREALAQERHLLLAQQRPWADILHAHGLEIATHRLQYFSHWLTPPSVPRRFDTRFFLAALPQGQQALADTEETIDGQWITPKQALDNHRQGDWLMIDPTIRSLEALAQYASVEEALVAVSQEQHVLPWTEALGRQGMQPFK